MYSAWRQSWYTMNDLFSLWSQLISSALSFSASLGRVIPFSMWASEFSSTVMWYTFFWYVLSYCRKSLNTCPERFKVATFLTVPTFHLSSHGFRPFHIYRCIRKMNLSLLINLHWIQWFYEKLPSLIDEWLNISVPQLLSCWALFGSWCLRKTFLPFCKSNFNTFHCWIFFNL